MSGMRLLDRHMTLFSGSLRTLLQRESDRRRWADSPYAWLFQPYMGEEAVAMACQVSAVQPAVMSVAAVVLSPPQPRGRTLPSRSWNPRPLGRGGRQWQSAASRVAIREHH